jgi:peptide chain release factor 1
MCLVEIRPGEGGADAEAFAADLVAAISSWATRRGWALHRRSSTGGRTTVLTLIGVRADQVSWLAGTHRLQHVPRNDRRGRRHTSTATVAVLAEAAAVRDPAVRAEELRIETMRGRGRGGQRKNKVETAVRLCHLPTGIVVTRTSGRSQSANLASARAELHERLRLRAEHETRRRTARARRRQVRPDRSAKSFTHNAQRAEVIDHTTGRRWTTRDWRQGRLDDAST